MKEDLIHLRFKQAIHLKQNFAAIRLPNTPEVNYFFTEDIPALVKVKYQQYPMPVFYVSPYGASEKAYQFLPSCVYQDDNLVFGDALPEIENNAEAVWNYKPFAPNFEADVLFYSAYVNQIKTAIKKNKLDKVVAARCETWPYQSQTSFANEFENACKKYPEACVYFFHLDGIGTWMGASPELLISVKNTTITSVALAGTKPADAETDWSQKEYEEQDMIAFFLEEAFKNCKPGRFSFSALSTIKAGGLNHLYSKLTCNSNQAFLQDKFHKLLQAINPTPAVCGLPQFESSLFIGENEKLERRFYTGFLGINWPDGNLDFYVNLRCAELFKEKINLYAGAGISHLSQATSEFDETSHKIATMKTLFS